MKKEMIFNIYLPGIFTSISFIEVYRIELVKDSYRLHGKQNEVIGFIPVLILKNNLRVLRKYETKYGKTISYEIDLQRKEL